MRFLALALLLAGCGDPFGTERASQAKRLAALEKQVSALRQDVRAARAEAAEAQVRSIVEKYDRADSAAAR